MHPASTRPTLAAGGMVKLGLSGMADSIRPFPGQGNKKLGRRWAARQVSLGVLARAWRARPLVLWSRRSTRDSEVTMKTNQKSLGATASLSLLLALAGAVGCSNDN